MPNEKILSEKDRAKLDGIISKMIENKESDEDIQFVVDDFKNKYGTSELKKKDNFGGSPSPSVGSISQSPSEFQKQVENPFAQTQPANYVETTETQIPRNPSIVRTASGDIIVFNSKSYFVYPFTLAKLLPPCVLYFV